MKTTYYANFNAQGEHYIEDIEGTNKNKLIKAVRDSANYWGHDCTWSVWTKDADGNEHIVAEGGTISKVMYRTI